MRVAQPDEARKPILHGLRLIVEFLNAIGPDTTRDQWRAYLKEFHRKNGTQGPFIASRGTGGLVAAVTLEKAKEVRQFIASDLRYLHFDRERVPTTETPFGPLTVRLNEQFKAGSWHCAALGTGKAEPSQAILTLKRKDDRTERWAATFVPFRVTRTLKEKLYAILGRALLTGDLARLKVCRHCGKYLVAVKDRKMAFCEATKCKQTFHNHERGGTTYYKDRRQKQRKEAIEKASQLLATGRARKVSRRTLFDQIKKATELPRKELEKVFGDE